MGNRVAELKVPGYDGTSEGYCVFQSTSMACFTPIFFNQLAAELFAQTLQTIYPDYSDKAVEGLADRVNDYIAATFGQHPEDHKDYDEYLTDVDLFAVLRSQFLAGWASYKRVSR